MELLFFAVWCRPFHNYWSVPAANPQCSTYHDHLVVNTVFNISSDLMMLCIPLPILIRAKLPLQKKLILCIVFSMGIFVIICAVLSKYYSFSLPYGIDWVRSIPSSHPSLIVPKHICADSPPIKRSTGTSVKSQPPSSSPTCPTSGPWCAAPSTSGPSSMPVPSCAPVWARTTVAPKRRRLMPDPLRSRTITENGMA